jgi:hypothetical protein
MTGAEPRARSQPGPGDGPGVDLLRRGEAVAGPIGGRAGIDDRCAPSAVRRGDSRPGTASPVPRWFLVEQPGGWGMEAVLESGLDPRVGAALLARARPVGARVLLIRRPGRQVPDGPRRWAVVDSRAGSERVGWGRWDQPEQLLDVPLDQPVGEPGGPLYLVCAHGRHDACCAIRGRPVADALAATRPGQVWECSHVGGDRFAANLIALPHGLFYAHVDVEGATDLATAYERGEVHLGLLRGRSAFAAPAQAAQHYARMALGETGLDALRPLGLARLAADRWRVRLAAPDGGTLLVTVRAGVGPPVRLTCTSGTAQHPRRWELVALRPAPLS